MLSRTTSDVASTTGAGLPPLITSAIAVTAARPLSATSWCTVVSGGRLAAARTLSSKPTRRDRRYLQAERLGGADRREGEVVGEADHAGGAVRPVEQGACGVVRGRRRAVRRGDDHRLDADRVQGVVPTQHPLASREVQRLGIGLQGDDPDPAVAEVDQVLGGQAGAAAVVDVDRGHALAHVVVDDDHRDVAPLQPADVGRGGVADVDERSVDGDVTRRHERLVRRRRQQRERHAAVGQLVGDRREEGCGDRVFERLAEAAVDEQPDRTGATAGQCPGRRVGAAVAELVGRGQDSLAQLGGELVGTRERVGHRHPADADAVRDRLEGHLGHR